MLCSWEGTSHASQVSAIPSYGLSCLRKGDEHPSYTPMEYSTFLFNVKVKKVKVVPNSIRALGPELIPVSRQSARSDRLPLLSARPAFTFPAEGLVRAPGAVVFLLE